MPRATILPASRISTLAASFIVLLCLAFAADAHVALDSPNGGESLDAGSTFSIDWHPTVEHGTIDWDLWYTTVGSEAAEDDWVTIANDLPLGDPTADSPHSFLWTVPNMSAGDVWVRVRQDNEGDDYFDVSDASFEIVSTTLAGDYNDNGVVDTADYSVWRDALVSGDLAADGNSDGQVGNLDYQFWWDRFGTSASSQATAVPEPMSKLIAALFMIALLMPRHRHRTHYDASGWVGTV